ncbi:hypothetical protein [Jiangella asiatica]|uniref:ABC transporter substrate-binding protein n=1 Tax=Jiangella asiatica TaxID=2530372 RepID=A0A4R5CQK4_9ACTN|nr:hypothetical protein [Jiangella asiatica]TDE00694.1 hypothetical protein E1269_24865 [Jiangella asiatica]
MRLSFGSGLNVHTEALVDGTVTPQGIELVPTVAHPSELFWRQLRYGEFDVCEMSLSSLFIAHARGSDLVALPVFPSRRFFHTELDVHVDAGVTEPHLLAGKRIGVGEYQQTAALWLRAVLEHDFGVSQYDVEWYMERGVEHSHGGATGFTPPDGISFHRVPPEKSLASMLLDRELDAAFVRPNRRTAATNFIERSQRQRGGDWSKVAPAFGDGVAEGARFFAAHGYIPINHAYVVRADLLRRHPWVAHNLCAAFLEAKLAGQRRTFERIPLNLVFRWEYLERTRAAVGEDPFPYGLGANRPVLESMVRFSHEQGLIPEVFPVDDLFAESTRLWSAGGQGTR